MRTAQPTEARTTTESRIEPTGNGTEPDDRARSGTTGTGRPDRRAASEGLPPSLTAPLAFDPSCARRLRNCVDAENGAFPDAD